MATKKQITLGGIAAIFLTAVALITSGEDLANKVDPLVVTELEAATAHAVIIADAGEQKQTQAGFNAYTLSSLLQQEIDILKLQIEVEEDDEELALLKEELKAKQAFVRKLQEEERRQLIEGTG